MSRPALLTPNAPASYRQKKMLAMLGHRNAFNENFTMSEASHLIDELQERRTHARPQSTPHARPQTTPHARPQTTPIVEPEIMTESKPSSQTEPTIDLVAIMATMIETSCGPMAVTNLCDRLKEQGHFVIAVTLNDLLAKVASEPSSSPRFVQFKAFVVEQKLIQNPRGGNKPKWLRLFRGEPSQKEIVPDRVIEMAPVGLPSDEMLPEMNQILTRLHAKQGKGIKKEVDRLVLITGISRIGDSQKLDELKTDVAALNDKMDKLTNLITDQRKKD
jgi:hypothetical protein